MRSPDPDSRDYAAELLEQRQQIEAPCNPAEYRVLKRIATSAENHFVVGLGGGTVHGLAGNIALVELLDELGLRPHIKEMWGCSAGAVIGAGYASGTTVAEFLTIVESLQHTGIDVPKWRLTKGLVGALFGGNVPDGLVLGRGFREAILRGQKVFNIEECEIPFSAIACTDDGHARKVIFREGPLTDAVCASLCIPGMMFPVEDWNGAPYGYFDGGVVEKTPLVSIIEEHARQARSTQLVVLCTHFDSSARTVRPVGFLPRFLSIINHLEEMLWTHQLATARAAKNCKFMVLNPKMPFGNMVEFQLVRVLHLWARKVFKQQLSNAGLATRFDAR